tara:strand:+ start:226 stop:498 length:273 start_codon:yes stop_codon:yes gene_type:complete
LAVAVAVMLWELRLDKMVVRAEHLCGQLRLELVQQGKEMLAVLVFKMAHKMVEAVGAVLMLLEAALTYKIILLMVVMAVLQNKLIGVLLH